MREGREGGRREKEGGRNEGGREGEREGRSRPQASFSLPTRVIICSSINKTRLEITGQLVDGTRIRKKDYLMGRFASR